MAGSAPKGSRLPLQKSLSRRVSFNESSLRRRDDADSEAQSGGGRRGSICNRCCFWISLIIGLLLFALILLGSVYFAFLQSNLPSVRLQVLEVNKIDVVSTSKDTLLTAEFVVHLNLTNGNGKAELYYKDMKGSFVKSTMAVFNSCNGSSPNLTAASFDRNWSSNSCNWFHNKEQPQICQNVG